MQTHEKVCPNWALDLSAIQSGFYVLLFDQKSKKLIRIQATSNSNNFILHATTSNSHDFDMRLPHNIEWSLAHQSDL